jgi:hypothetical protein
MFSENVTLGTLGLAIIRGTAYHEVFLELMKMSAETVLCTQHGHILQTQYLCSVYNQFPLQLSKK